MRLWIDTDVGDDPDDAIALWCASRHETFDLVGVSTVDGDTSARAELARELVPADVDVVAGMPDPARVAACEAFLGIGPWTNAAALAEAGALPAAVGMMGGVLAPIVHRGEMTRIEHNIGKDPHAAARLLETTGGLLVVPLDATARLRARADDERHLVAAIPPLAAHIERWRDGRDRRERPLILHDPAALLALAGEPIFRVETRRLKVTVEGGLHAAIDAPSQQVVAHFDADAVRTRVNTLAG
jgi:inosine-uridine nucleoside N-ribohydrolase